MSEELLVRHCSPTLAGLKTGNLFSCSVKGDTLFDTEIDELNRQLNQKGVKICVLNRVNERALVYVYRPSRLKTDLACCEARALLYENGYSRWDLDEIIRHLSERISGNAEFPHEIGLFLGYPIDDIKGFIKNKGKNCLCTGCWKVYCNQHEAMKTFNRFKKCTDVYCRKLNEGLSIMRLTIAA